MKSPDVGLEPTALGLLLEDCIFLKVTRSSLFVLFSKFALNFWIASVETYH